MTSYEETPRNFYANHSADGSYTTTFEDDSGPSLPKLSKDVAIPSWASRAATESDGSQDPNTVLSRQPYLGSRAVVRQKSSSSVEAESRPVKNIEEKPVSGAKKSFEELLAEQLGVSVSEIGQGAKQEPAFVRRNADGDKKAKTFLRKGSGLARYGGVGSPPKAFHRSKSQSNVSTDKNKTPPMNAMSKSTSRLKNSTSCSKLDIASRETIAFSSKKNQKSMKPNNITSNSSMSKSSTSLSVKSVQSNGSTSSKTVTNNNKVLPHKIVQTLTLKRKPEPVLRQQDQQQQQKLISIDKNDDRQSPIHDSVELSFKEKLKKADRSHKVR